MMVQGVWQKLLKGLYNAAKCDARNGTRAAVTLAAASYCTSLIRVVSFPLASPLIMWNIVGWGASCEQTLCQWIVGKRRLG